MTDCIALNDRGLAYGDGLFETIAVIDKQLHNWELHWQRLCSGAEKLCIELPAEQVFVDLISVNLQQHWIQQSVPLTEYVLKIIVTRGAGGRGYFYPENNNPTIIVTIHDWPQRNTLDYSSGVRAFVCETCLAKQPALAGIKHLNRLEQVLARNEFGQAQFAEGIMLACSDNDSNMDSLLIEATSSNLFFVINGCLFTPKIDTCGVQGTIRQLLLKQARQLMIPVEQGHYALRLLQEASEVFFTNSIYGIVPVASISIMSQRCWTYRERKLSAQLAALINTELKRPADFN